jgi:hypothetical protein
MSADPEGIWFPIANNHHPHNPTVDQPADNIRPAMNAHGISSVKSTDRQQVDHPFNLSVSDQISGHCNFGGWIYSTGN